MWESKEWRCLAEGRGKPRIPNSYRCYSQTSAGKMLYIFIEYVLCWRSQTIFSRNKKNECSQHQLLSYWQNSNRKFHMLTKQLVNYQKLLHYYKAKLNCLLQLSRGNKMFTVCGITTIPMVANDSTKRFTQFHINLTWS